MNTSGQDHEAHEWEAQERARRQVRDAVAAPPGAPSRRSGFSRGLPGMGTPSSASPQEAGNASYRHIAQALRRPPPVDLPPDFAARVARIAEARAPSPAAAEAPAFERVLVRALVFVFALCAVATGLVYGARVLAQLQAAIGLQGMQWTALLAGCLGLSWSFEWLRRRSGHRGAMRPA
jgi:hypothetical protein